MNWRQKRAKEKYYLGEIKRVLNDAREEQLGIRSDLIEHQLAHVVRDATGEAYNRTRFFPERIKLMQRWADYLEDLKEGGGTISNNVSIFRKEAWLSGEGCCLGLRNKILVLCSQPSL